MAKPAEIQGDGGTQLRPQRPKKELGPVFKAAAGPDATLNTGPSGFLGVWAWTDSSAVTVVAGLAISYRPL